MIGRASLRNAEAVREGRKRFMALHGIVSCNAAIADC